MCSMPTDRRTVSCPPAGATATSTATRSGSSVLRRWTRTSQSRSIIRQNLFISLAVIGLLIPSTLFGYTGIGLAVFFHEGSTLVVVFNALRLLAFK